MSAGAAPLPGLVSDRAIVTLRRVVAAGQVAQSILRLQMATGDASSRWCNGADSAAVRLARRAAQRSVEARDGGAVRAVCMAALTAAVDGTDADLRIRVLAEVAARFHEIGHHDESLELIHVAEEDGRISDRVRRDAQIKAQVLETDPDVAVEVGP